MRVLVVGSKSIHVSSYIKALNKKDIVPTFLAEEKIDYNEVEKNFVANFRSKNPFSIILNYFKVKKALRKAKPDVVHIHQANRLAYFVSRACAKKNIPCVLTAWGSDVLIVPQKSKLNYFLVKKIIERSRVVTADSKSMIDAMLEIEPAKDKYQLLQYGIEMISPGKKEKIIYSNRLHNPLYRIDKIIHYFNDFQKNNTEWKLIIAGSGSETENLKELVTDLNLNHKIDFIGWVDKKMNTEMYQKATIYISIPESDGTSVSLLEAMSAGCLPIVADLPVSREWILDGKSGVIENENENPFFDAVKLLDGPFATINKSVVESSASREHCTEKFVRIYQELMDK